jgi:hypothetical protein
MSENNNAGAKSTDQSDENTSLSIAGSNYPVPDARPYQSRHTLEIKEVKIENEKLRGEHGKL